MTTTTLPDEGVNVARLPHVMMAARPLSEDERALLGHITRWGSDGYPIVKLTRSRSWMWQYRGLSSPETFKTRRETVASFERHHDMLLDLAGAESYRRYRAEHPEQFAVSVGGIA